MHPQLQEIIDQFNTAQARLHRLVKATRPELWSRRPVPDRWSMAECVAHLNLTGAAFVPALRQALAAPGVPHSVDHRHRYRRDPIGWLLWWAMRPGARLRVKTSEPFIPRETAATAELVAEFDRLQEEQVACASAAEGLPLERLRIRSPFGERIRYNLYSALTILPRHQHRHLSQAEEVRTALQ